MAKSKESEDLRSKPIYEKPLFEEEKGLVFPLEVIEKFNGGRFCVQCSSCHGCQ